MSKELMFPNGVFATGHRPPAFGDWDEKSEMAQDVKKWLYLAVERAIKKGRTDFITGMAAGVDIWFGEAVLALKDKYPHVKLIAAVPYPGQAERWARFNRIRWERLIEAADELHILYDDPKEDAPKYEFAKRLNSRNEWMVDAAPVGIAVHHSEYVRGGTVNCLAYAKRKKRAVLIYDPLKKAERWINRET
jgi:uncharacterized phage-like protein YoqJ